MLVRKLVPVASLQLLNVRNVVTMVGIRPNVHQHPDQIIDPPAALPVTVLGHVQHRREHDGRVQLLLAAELHVVLEPVQLQVQHHRQVAQLAAPGRLLLALTALAKVLLVPGHCLNPQEILEAFFDGQIFRTADQGQVELVEVGGADGLAFAGETRRDVRVLAAEKFLDHAADILVGLVLQGGFEQ